MKRERYIVENNIEYLWCGHCKKYKVIEEFYFSSVTADGYSQMCKDCCSEYNRKNWRKYSKLKTKKIDDVEEDTKEEIDEGWLLARRMKLLLPPVEYRLKK